MKRKNTGHVIRKVYPDSIGEEMGIQPGDTLLAINNEVIEDIFDYGFYIQDTYIEVLIGKPDGEEWLLEIDKDDEEDLGLAFDNDLMSEYRSCSNGCIFCFIDQMPPGMRETLYFKDDDSRLSFLQGNYITLTNMKDKDVDRIIRMQLAPINISVQTTNPELRCKMLGNRFAGEKLAYLQRLYQGHVEMNGQIVLCKNVNDGHELHQTITELTKYLPYMKSVSVVPVGMTKFRQGLFPLEKFNKEDAENVIDMVESFQQDCWEKYGLHFIHASDEWYIAAGRPFPEESRYDGYLQLENGVGMMRLFIDEFEFALQERKENHLYPEQMKLFHHRVTVATGRLAYPVICQMAVELMEAFPHLTVHVCCIRNDFFGETITVSGLVTGGDLIQQMKERQAEGENLGNRLLIPSNMLRAGEQMFLDDVTIADVEKALGIQVTAAESQGTAWIESILRI